MPAEEDQGGGGGGGGEKKREIGNNIFVGLTSLIILH